MDLEDQEAMRPTVEVRTRTSNLAPLPSPSPLALLVAQLAFPLLVAPAHQAEAMFPVMRLPAVQVGPMEVAAQDQEMVNASLKPSHPQLSLFPRSQSRQLQQFPPLITILLFQQT